MKKRILILCHEHVPRTATYTIFHLKREWERQGMDVQVCFGTSEVIEADLVFNHVDLTITPHEYLDFLQRYPVVINESVTDISKTVISKYLVGPEDRHPGRVIIKTNANYGGRRESALARLRRRKSLPQRSLRKVLRFASRHRGWARAESLDPNRYPIFDSIRDVPEDVWTNSDLVVEKFLPEVDPDGNYLLRAWSFLGDKSLNVMTTAPTPVVRGRNIARREILEETIHPALVSRREQLRFDYGRFDYAMVEGEVVLYDTNRTPTTSRRAFERYSQRLQEMALGILSFCQPR